MSHQTANLSELLGSRICHDLISPLGAISNGIELLTMSSADVGPEIMLISESIANANARVQFFRIAYGAASGDLSVNSGEVRSILGAYSHGGRTHIDWTPAGDVARPYVKAAFLAIQCLETALAFGGQITVSRDENQWLIGARADRIKVDSTLWDGLKDVGNGHDVAAAHIQFALLPLELARLKKTARVAFSQTDITLEY